MFSDLRGKIRIHQSSDHRGFNPELYTVAAGSFADNAAHSPVEPAVNTYAPFQLSRGVTTIPLGSGFVSSKQGCNIRQRGNEVEFDLSICLDGNSTPGFAVDEELRIRPLQNWITRLLAQRNPLPIPQKPNTSVRLDGVEIVDKDGVQVAPRAAGGSGSWLLSARVLLNGAIALTKLDPGAVTLPGSPVSELPLVAEDIAAALTTDNVVVINIHGSYLAENVKQL